MNLFQTVINALYNDGNGIVLMLGGMMGGLVELTIVVFFAAYIATKMSSVKAFWAWAIVSITAAVAWGIHLILSVSWEGFVWPERGIDLMQLGYALPFLPWPLTHLLIIPVLINGYEGVVKRATAE
ncbi:MAG: hypothetical protein RL431_928 [Actinomycetota bacterium]|jgi:hypothetical protein